MPANVGIQCVVLAREQRRDKDGRFQMQLLMGLQHAQTVRTSILEQSGPDLSNSELEQQQHAIDSSSWADSPHVTNATHSLSVSQQQWQWEDIEAILNS